MTKNNTKKQHYKPRVNKKLNEYISNERYSVKNLSLKSAKYEDKYTRAYEYIKKTHSYNCELEKTQRKTRKQEWEN